MITTQNSFIVNALGMDGFTVVSARKATQKAFHLYEELKENDYDIDTLRSIAERESSLDYAADKLSKIILCSILIVCKDFYINGVLSVFHIDSHDELILLSKLMAAIRQHEVETQVQINQRSVHQLNTDELTRMKRKVILLQMENEKNEELYWLTSKKLYSKSKELDELKEKQASVQPLVVQINNISGCNVIQGDIHLNKEK